MKLRILKCHGSGNDFILLDEATGMNPGIPEPRRADLARTLCDRKTGVGADGILFYANSGSADCRMRMFNPDGSEAEMCGNGLRCIGRYCAEARATDEVAVETMKATLVVRRAEPIFEGVETFEAQIGPVSLAPGSLPMVTDADTFIGARLPDLADDLEFTALSVPNPHLVAIVERIDEKRVHRCGVAANRSATFPGGVNLSFVRIRGTNRIFTVTYERGVGITCSCGTAMSASAYVSALVGATDREQPILVFNKGGMVVVDVSGGGSRMLLKGNATFVFDTVVETGEDCNSIERRYDEDTRIDEIRAYEKAQDYARSLIRESERDR